MDPRLFRLRIELYTAAQSLRGEDAEAFWTLIREGAAIESAPRPRPAAARVDEACDGMRDV